MTVSIFLKIYPTGKADKFFKGNCQVKAHTSWIEISDYSHTFTQKISAATPSSDLGPAARCDHENLSFKKYNDNATDDLMKACWVGQCLDLEIHMYRSLGNLTGSEGAAQELINPSNKSFVVNVKRAYITNFGIEPTGAEGGTENLSIAYNYIQYAYAELDFVEGTLNKTTQQAISWSWTDNEISKEKPTW